MVTQTGGDLAGFSEASLATRKRAGYPCWHPSFVVTVPVDSLDADHKDLCDLLGGTAFGDQPDHLFLSRGENRVGQVVVTANAR